MQKINDIKDLNLKDLKFSESFYTEGKDNRLKNVYTVSSNNFDCLLSINNVCYGYEHRPNVINDVMSCGNGTSTFLEYYLYNESNKFLEIDDIWLGMNEVTAEELIRLLCTESKEKKKEIRQDFSCGRYYIDAIAFPYNENISLAFVTKYYYDRGRLSVGKTVCTVGDKQKIYSMKLNGNFKSKKDMFKKVYSLVSKRSKIVTQYIKDNNQFYDKTLMEIMMDEELTEKLNKIAKSIMINYMDAKLPRMMQPVAEHNNVKMYCNFMMQPPKGGYSYPSFFFKINEEYCTDCPDDKTLKILMAFYDFRINSCSNGQIIDPETKDRSLGKDEYTIGGYMRIKSYGTFMYFEKIDDLWIANNTQDYRNEVDGAIKTYEKLLEE